MNTENVNTSVRFFTKIPNLAMYTGKDSDDKSIVSEIGYDCRVLQVLDYLYEAANVKGIARFSIENAVIFCGYKPNGNKGKVNDAIRHILTRLNELGYVSFIVILAKLNPPLLLCAN